jgi:hypothetical protein
MWNSRVTLTVLASAAALILMCVLLGFAYAPVYGDRRAVLMTRSADSRGTEIAAATQAVGATELAFRPTQTAVAGATLTEAARPTITPTPTATPTPTDTPTATPPAAIVECPATVAGTRQRLYPVPGGGQVREAVPLERGTPLLVIGRLEDGGWLQVQTETGELGWMPSEAVDPASSACQANIYDLSYLLGLTDTGSVAIDDTFISNENGWANAAGEPLSPVLSASGDAQLVLSTNDLDWLRTNNPRVPPLPAFHLVTSFARLNYFSDSYVGVRFRSNDLTYYDVRVARSCQIGVYATNELIFTRPVDPGENTCVDDQEDWLMVSLSPDNRLTVQLNDSDSFEVFLEDPSGLYTGEEVALVVNRARVTFSYLVITALP